MPPLDFASMAILIAINLAVMGAALPLVMGNAVSQAARHAQRYFLLQAFAWGSILWASRMRGLPMEPAVSLASTCCAAAAQWQMAQALQNWLGPRGLRPVLILLCVLGPLGFALHIEHIPNRMAWFSVCHGLSVWCLGFMCLRPTATSSRSWRYLIAGCAGVMGCSLFSRAYLVLNTGMLSEFATEGSANYVFAAIAQICSTLVLVSVLVAWRDESNLKLREMALSDQLTGLANRHALLQAAPRMFSTAHRQAATLAVMLLDIDHFKAINDQYGHARGDRALQVLAQMLKSEMRAGEIAARWGGEEFCLLIYAEPHAAEMFFQRLSSALRRISQQELGFELSMSAGCAFQIDAARELPELLQQADNALYQAKASGRNRLAFEPQHVKHQTWGNAIEH